MLNLLVAERERVSARSDEGGGRIKVVSESSLIELGEALACFTIAIDLDREGRATKKEPVWIVLQLRGFELLGVFAFQTWNPGVGKITHKDD